MFTTKEAIQMELKRVASEVESLGLEVVSVRLYGSQNYGLESPESDVDSVVIVMPTVEEIATGAKPTSKTLHFPGGSQADVKEVREYFKLLKKQNPKYLETLFTEYHYTPEKYSEFITELIEIGESVARYSPDSATRAIIGMMYQKLKALKHPYPSKLEVLEKYGYDPKQAMHIFRLAILAEFYAKGHSYEAILKPDQFAREFLLNIKLKQRPSFLSPEAYETFLETIEDHCKSAIAVAEKFSERFAKELEPCMETQKEIDAQLTRILIEFFKTKFV